MLLGKKKDKDDDALAGLPTDDDPGELRWDRERGWWVGSGRLRDPSRCRRA
jgi:hypothetical protein